MEMIKDIRHFYLLRFFDTYPVKVEVYRAAQSGRHYDRKLDHPATVHFAKGMKGEIISMLHRAIEYWSSNNTGRR